MKICKSGAHATITKPYDRASRAANEISSPADVSKTSPDVPLSPCEYSIASQDSLLREIQELHDRVIANLNKDQVLKPPSRSKAVEMATQTEPNVIPDVPVLKSEYDVQIDYMEKSLTDHERRVRANELRGDKSDRRINKIDADYFNTIAVLKSTQDLLLSEVQEHRRTIEFLMECRCCSAKCPCDVNTMPNGTESVSNPNVRPVERLYPELYTKKQSKPMNPQVRDAQPQGAASSTSNDIATKNGAQVEKPKAVEKKKGESVFNSFMKAASRAIPQQIIRNNRSVVTRKDEDVPEVRNANQETTTVKSGSKDLKNADHARPDGPNVSSVPIDLTQKKITHAFSTNPGVSRDVVSNPAGLATPKNTKINTASKPDNMQLSPVEFPLLPRPLGAVHLGRQQQLASTPIPQPGVKSWADDDDEVSKTIQVFLAEIERNGEDTSFTDNNGRNVTQRGPRNKATMLSQAENGQNNDNNPRDYSTKTNNNGGQLDTGNKGFDSNKPNSQATYGGARPKLGRKGECVEDMCNDVNPDDLDEVNNPFKVVTRNGWRPPEKKRKRTKSNNKAQPPLSAAQSNRYKDIFVRDLNAVGYDNKEAMEDAIIEYCDARNVDLYFIRIMYKKSDPDIANVKITVDGASASKVLNPTFWPKDATVREWHFNGGGNPKPVDGNKP